MKPTFEYLEGIFPDDDVIYNALSAGLNWLRRPGGERDEFYMYRGTGKPVPDAVNHVWNHVEKMSGQLFNSCCAERYLHATDGSVWRSDSGKTIDMNKPLIVACFGDTREMWFKPFGENASKDVFTKYLCGGSVLALPPHFPENFRYKISGDMNMAPLITLSFKHVLLT